MPIIMGISSTLIMMATNKNTAIIEGKCRIITQEITIITITTTMEVVGIITTKGTTITIKLSMREEFAILNPVLMDLIRFLYRL